MKSTYRLGRIAGVEVGLNWSVLALLALLMWTLATGVFPETNPGLGDNAHFAMAVVAALGFFASILLHELGHAVQARRDGMEIDGITLWLFGGVARFRGMFPTAGAEFRIAIAGPLVTLALAGLFVGGALVGLPEVADGVCAWLGFINLLLLAFNLIPSLPLDGGRMLRAAIWHFKGDIRSATRIAAGSGRVFSILMIAAGVAITVMGGLISGIWLVFIGWFLLQAAGAEARIVQDPRVVAAGLRVRDLMTDHPVTLADAQTLAEVADEVRRSRHEAYPVLHDGVPVGLFPAVALTAVPEAAWDAERVGDHMAARDEIPSLEPEDGIEVAVAALRSSRLQRALVIDDGDLVGVLSLGDVARALGARPA
ncbi:MAG: site-2 protease family protein [Thermoleophilia bacterium]